MVLFDYIKSLSEADRCKIRDKFLRDSGISRSAYYYKWRKGNWSKLELSYLKHVVKTIK